MATSSHSSKKVHNVLPESIGSNPDGEDEIAMSGWLKKQDSRYSSLWKERYFVMKGPHIAYYLKESDLEQPRATFTLRPSCIVSQVKTTSDKKQNPYFIFEVLWPKEEDEEDDIDDGKSVIDGVGNSKQQQRLGNGSSRAIFRSKSKKEVEKDKKEGKSSKMSNIKVAALALGGVIAGTLTSGIGLLAGMTVIGMGAAAGTGAVALSNSTSGIELSKQLICACDSYEEAERWIQIIKAQIREMNDGLVGGVLHSISPKDRVHSLKKRLPPAQIRFKIIEEWIESIYWKVYSVRDGIRIFEHRPHLEDRTNSDFNSGYSPDTVIEANPPCFKANIGANGSLIDVFMTIMNLEKEACRTGIIKAARMIETIDNNTDIIHLLLEPVYLSPVWSAPRDFCLMRYWKQNPDGCYIVCLTSVSHSDCPVMTGYVRGDLQAAYVISPPLEDEFEEDQTESLITFVAQCDPKGWIWNSHDYKHKFLEILMMHILDFRDIIDSDRFIPAQIDSFVVESEESEENDKNDELEKGDEQGRKIALIPPSLLPKEMWDNINEDSFQVRGKSYLKDKVKIKSLPAVFKLIAVDLIQSSTPVYNVCSHPRNRVKLAHDRGEKFWCFVVNLMIPGTTSINIVAYFLGEKSLFEENTPFAKIGKQFFFGNDDDYRNKRFKLIPKIVEGNFIVKNTVKETPAIMGMKVSQHYHRDDHYFELSIDVGSSSIARHTTGLALGYSKQLKVDMAFCLEGKEEDELPEILLGGYRCVYVDMGTAKEM